MQLTRKVEVVSHPALAVDGGRLEVQLCSDRWLAPDGRVLSWLGSRGDAYPYDEATALFGRLFRWRGESARAQRCAEVLERRIERDGFLGRDGIAYAFDTALALPLLARPEATAERVLDLLEEGLACRPLTRSGWWSQSWGAHLLRCLPPLARLGHESAVDRIALRLVESCFDGERFLIHGESDWTYVHSHCYALEGLLGLGGYSEVVLAGAQWLARLQAPDGSLPHWTGREPGERPSDAVAQALRLWAAIDSSSFAPAIGRARRWLARRQHWDGAIVYSAECPDHCSWASAFTLQAVQWADAGVGEQDLALLV